MMIFLKWILAFGGFLKGRDHVPWWYLLGRRWQVATQLASCRKTDPSHITVLRLRAPTLIYNNH